MLENQEYKNFLIKTGTKTDEATMMLLLRELSPGSVLSENLTKLNRIFLKHLLKNPFGTIIIAFEKQSGRGAGYVIAVRRPFRFWSTFILCNPITFGLPLFIKKIKLIIKKFFSLRFFKKKKPDRAGEREGEDSVEFSWFPSSSKIARIFFIGVLPEFRGSGLATALYFFLSKFLKGAGCTKIEAHIDGGNESSVRLHQKTGWQIQKCCQGDYKAVLELSNNIELRPLTDIDYFAWDKIISKFDSKGLFHQSAWLDFVEKTQGGKRFLLEIVEGGKTIGYFPCFVLRKGPFKVLGSPLVGWTTNFMGPIVNEGFNQRGFLDALEKYCKSQKIDQLELSNSVLKPEIMRTRGFQYREGITYIVKLSDEKVMWDSLKSECRTAIRKAIKNNLIVEDTDDPKIIDEYYNQIIEVFTKQRLVPTYSYDRPRVLFNCLKKEDLLFALRVKYKNEVIAAGFFPHDEKIVYFFGGASREKFHHLRPNDLLHWTAMIMASKRGISEYDMCGGGAFKPKFGGKLIKEHHWYKSYNSLARIARFAYQHQLRALQRIKGLIRKYAK